MSYFCRVLLPLCCHVILHVIHIHDIMKVKIENGQWEALVDKIIMCRFQNRQTLSLTRLWIEGSLHQRHCTENRSTSEPTLFCFCYVWQIFQRSRQKIGDKHQLDCIIVVLGLISKVVDCGVKSWRCFQNFNSQKCHMCKKWKGNCPLFVFLLYWLLEPTDFNIFRWWKFSGGNCVVGGNYGSHFRSVPIIWGTVCQR